MARPRAATKLLQRGAQGSGARRPGAGPGPSGTPQVRSWQSRPQGVRSLPSLFIFGATGAVGPAEAPGCGSPRRAMPGAGVRGALVGVGPLGARSWGGGGGGSLDGGGRARSAQAQTPRSLRSLGPSRGRQPGADEAPFHRDPPAPAAPPCSTSPAPRSGPLGTDWSLVP